MKKLTRAAIAGSAGIALMAGGATFALWSDSETAGGATITSGTLALDPVADGWYDVTNGESPISDIGAYRIVPGATIEYRGTFTVDATGDNLAATLEATAPVKSGSGELHDAATVTPTITLADAPLTSQAITDEDNGKTVSVKIEVKVPDSLTLLSGQEDTFTISNAVVTLTQTTPVS